MGVILFNVTLLVMLASIFASACALAVYLVSHQRAARFACIGFLFYFFDVAWVFQDGYVMNVLSGDESDFYLFARSVASLAVGCGFLTAFWLMFCEHLGDVSRVLKIAPAVVFTVGGLLLLVLMPESNMQRFLFYTLRAVYLAWMLVFAAARYLRADPCLRERLARYRPLYGALWVLGALVVAADAFNFLIAPGVLYASVSAPALVGSEERNYVENMLMLLCCIVAVRSAVRSLSIRFERPPAATGGRQEAAVEENLKLYARRHGLSVREEEVLHRILQGKDNQNIASEMQLALSTVKVHVHNILKKTQQPSRQDLVRDFWKMS